MARHNFGIPRLTRKRDATTAKNAWDSPLEAYARRIGGVQVDRGDTKQDLCNKIFDRVGLRGQNQFDKIVSGIIGIPTAQEQFLAPAPMQPARVVRSRVVYVPELTVTDRKIAYPEKITQFFLENAQPMDTLEAAAGTLYTNLEKLLNLWYDEYKLVLSFEDAQGKRYDLPTKNPILQSVIPKAQGGKRSVLLINTPKKDAIIGRLEFQVKPRDVVVEETARVPTAPMVQPAVEELADEIALRLLMGEQVETATKKRGVGQ